MERIIPLFGVVSPNNIKAVSQKPRLFNVGCLGDVMSSFGEGLWEFFKRSGTLSTFVLLLEVENMPPKNFPVLRRSQSAIKIPYIKTCIKKMTIKIIKIWGKSLSRKIFAGVQWVQSTGPGLDSTSPARCRDN